MQRIIATRAQVDVTQATDKHGKRYAVVIAKATYAFPAENDRRPVLAKEQLPLFEADLFEGEPGLSTPFFESDYVLRKSRCDVVLKATAHAPEGKPVTALQAGFRLAGCGKLVQIVGDRRWEKGLLGLSIGKPEPFTSMPITYGRAYGGSWTPEKESDEPEAYLRNPVGTGFGGKKNRHRLAGSLLPNLEQPGVAIKDPNGSYTPWSFGPVARSWQPRLPLAGTYDEQWHAEVFPLLPSDFDEAFFQCAPEDQQIDYPQGGEMLDLLNLHPTRPHIRFPLPRQPMPMRVLTRERETQLLQPVIDTIQIDADAQTLALVWRAQVPLKRSMREIEAVAVGQVSARHWAGVASGDAGCAGCGASAEAAPEKDEAAA